MIRRKLRCNFKNMKKKLNKFIEDTLHENKMDVLDNSFLAAIKRARQEGTLADGVTIDLDNENFHLEQPEEISKIEIDN